MPGVKGRSGRRKIADVPQGFKLPDLDGTADSVIVYTAELAKAVARGPDAGGIDPRVGDSLEKIAARHLAAVFKKSEKGELLAKLRMYKERLDEMERQASEREVADRQHTRKGGDVAPAVWDDEDPKH